MKKTEVNSIIRTVFAGIGLVVVTQITGFWLLTQYISQTAAGIHEGIHTLQVESLKSNL